MHSVAKVLVLIILVQYNTRTNGIVLVLQAVHCNVLVMSTVHWFRGREAGDCLIWALKPRENEETTSADFHPEYAHFGLRGRKPRFLNRKLADPDVPFSGHICYIPPPKIDHSRRARKLIENFPFPPDFTPRDATLQRTTF